jgi:hypothetical protein
MPTNFPKDPSENAFPEILGGDQAKQVDAVRAYLLTLGPGGGAPRTRTIAPAASPAPPARVGANPPANQTER